MCFYKEKKSFGYIKEPSEPKNKIVRWDSKNIFILLSNIPSKNKDGEIWIPNCLILCQKINST